MTPPPQCTVSPPVTISSCSSGTPQARRQRAASGEPHHGGPGAQGDGVGTVEVVEVGVADEDEVGLAHLGGRQADGVEAGHSIEVGVEEEDGPAGVHPEGGRPEPLHRCPHRHLPPRRTHSSDARRW